VGEGHRRGGGRRRAAAACGGRALAGARPYADARRAAGTAARRLPRGHRDDAFLLRSQPDEERRRDAQAARACRMKYLVTGAAGFIGSHLTEALVADGHEVVAVDCFTDYYDPAQKEENAAAFEVSRLDLAEDELALEGSGGGFHLAGQPGGRPSFADFDVYVRRNIVASQKVFASAVRAGVRVVFASSSSVYGEAETYPTAEDARPQPISPYGVTKLTCEHLAHAY